MSCFDFLHIFSGKHSRNRKKKNHIDTDIDTNNVATMGQGAPLHRYEGGRQFHGNENVAYVLPNDVEEDDRLHLQHWTIKLAFGSSFDAPVQTALEDGTNVLDSACGPGTWALELANSFPNSNFYGTDISPRFPNNIKPKNCTFLVHNVIDEPPFDENFFGYIHQRLLLLGIKAAEWPGLLQRLKFTLKPGGWIELTEFSYCNWGNLGPCTKTGNEINIQILGDAGFDIDLGSNLARLLAEAGFTNIQSRAIDMPINHSGKMGELFWEDAREAFKSLNHIYSKIKPEFKDPEVFAKFIEDCGEECRNNKTTLPWTRIIAQKPLEVDI
ncbi:S-adenosyl-L-methionine-dependent methyltransferase [Dichotomocladium elegans]|nr:S-adenosyl-L-methionine-dependent methyltransferase [Dichotomocladium elegans]